MRYAPITERLAGLGSDKWVLHSAAQTRRAQGLEVINLTIGEPDVPTPADLIETATRSMRKGRTGYSNGQGEPTVLGALSDYYGSKLGRSISRQRFLCLPGTQTALYLAFIALLEPGCEVILGDPMYATYEALIRASGATPVPVALRPEAGFRLQVDDVARQIGPATRALFLNTPHNPTGAILTQEDLDALCDLAVRHDLWVISDEVYQELTHGEALFNSALANPTFEDRVIVASSISKSHAAPGFRSGWLCGPEEFCRRALPVSETMLFGSQPFIADMTAEALRASPEVARNMAARMARRAQIIHSRLDGVAGMRVHLPEAGMFALLDIRALSCDSQSFALGLLETTGVAVMPGASFGAALEGWLRIALNAPDDVTDDACSRIVSYAQREAA